jgi:hypothetical protein
VSKLTLLKVILSTVVFFASLMDPKKNRDLVYLSFGHIRKYATA